MKFFQIATLIWVFMIPLAVQCQLLKAHIEAAKNRTGNRNADSFGTYVLAQRSDKQASAKTDVAENPESNPEVVSSSANLQNSYVEGAAQNNGTATARTANKRKRPRKEQNARNQKDTTASGRNNSSDVQVGAKRQNTTERTTKDGPKNSRIKQQEEKIRKKFEENVNSTLSESEASAERRPRRTEMYRGQGERSDDRVSSRRVENDERGEARRSRTRNDEVRSERIGESQEKMVRSAKRRIENDDKIVSDRRRTDEETESRRKINRDDIQDSSRRSQARQENSQEETIRSARRRTDSEKDEKVSSRRRIQEDSSRMNDQDEIEENKRRMQGTSEEDSQILSSRRKVMQETSGEIEKSRRTKTEETQLEKSTKSIEEHDDEYQSRRRTDDQTLVEKTNQKFDQDEINEKRNRRIDEESSRTRERAGEERTDRRFEERRRQGDTDRRTQDEPIVGSSRRREDRRNNVLRSENPRRGEARFYGERTKVDEVHRDSQKRYEEEDRRSNSRRTTNRVRDDRRGATRETRFRTDDRRSYSQQSSEDRRTIETDRQVRGALGKASERDARFEDQGNLEPGRVVHRIIVKNKQYCQGHECNQQPYSNRHPLYQNRPPQAPYYYFQ